MRIAILALCPIVALSCDSRPPATEPVAFDRSAQGRIATGDDFERDNTLWEFAEGQWKRRSADGAGVLVQTGTDRHYPVALFKKHRLSDCDVSVRFKPVSGKIDASGGIIVRAQDPRNYYIARANALEGNFRLYATVDGTRSQLASTSVQPPPIGQWHALRVVAAGTRIQAYLNGQLLIDHRDEKYAAGWVGLWTKEDAVTEFDDLRIEGVEIK